MNSSTLRNLGIVLFVLVAILVGLELADRPATVDTGQPLFAELRQRINDIDRVTIERAGTEPTVIARDDDAWSVGNRDGYPADVAKVREVLLALADARVLEQKTADPARYEALGVRDPEIGGSRGVRLTASGPGADFAVVIGDTGQGPNRYVRLAGEATSVLVDANPSLPDSVGGWLDSGIVDVPTSRIREASIVHADGESIRVYKSSAEEADFTVPGIPDGRELSYPSVANSIAGALADLDLEDVRRSDGAEPQGTASFATFDGLEITVDVHPDEDAAWIALTAAARAPEAVEAAAEGDADEAAEAPPAGPGVDPAAEATGINARVAGWQYRVPSFKANQLTRRWEDILEPEPDEDTAEPDDEE